MKNQQGLVLVLSLLILISVTILGVSAVSSSLLQSKMAISQQESGLAFDAAEAAIAGVVYEAEDKDLALLNAAAAPQDALSQARLGNVYDPNVDNLQCSQDVRWTNRAVTEAGLQNQTRHTAEGDYNTFSKSESWSRTAYIREQTCLGSSAVVGGVNINCHVFIIRGCGTAGARSTVVANTLTASIVAPAAN